MRYFLLFFIFAVCGCKKEVLSLAPSFDSDKIHKDYSAKIKEFESEHAEIKKSIDEANSRIQEVDFSPKVAELIKSEIYTQEKYLRIIEQEIAFLKIEDNNRKTEYSTKELTQDGVDKEYEEYLLSEKANPRKFIWRLRPGLVLPPKEVDGTKKTDSHKKDEKHSDKKPEEHKSTH